jgi:hypothetical protein
MMLAAGVNSANMFSLQNVVLASQMMKRWMELRITRSG